MLLQKTFTTQRQIQGKTNYNGEEVKLTVTVNFEELTGDYEIVQITVSERRFLQIDGTTTYSAIRTEIDVTHLPMECSEHIDWEEVYYNTISKTTAE